MLEMDLNAACKIFEVNALGALAWAQPGWRVAFGTTGLCRTILWESKATCIVFTRKVKDTAWLLSFTAFSAQTIHAKRHKRIQGKAKIYDHL